MSCKESATIVETSFLTTCCVVQLCMRPMWQLLIRFEIARDDIVDYWPSFSPGWSFPLPPLRVYPFNSIFTPLSVQKLGSCICISTVFIDVCVHFMDCDLMHFNIFSSVGPGLWGAAKASGGSVLTGGWETLWTGKMWHFRRPNWLACFWGQEPNLGQ